MLAAAAVVVGVAAAAAPVAGETPELAERGVGAIAGMLLTLTGDGRPTGSGDATAAATVVVVLLAFAACACCVRGDGGGSGGGGRDGAVGVPAALVVLPLLAPTTEFARDGGLDVGGDGAGRRPPLLPFPSRAIGDGSGVCGRLCGALAAISSTLRSSEEATDAAREGGRDVGTRNGGGGGGANRCGPSDEALTEAASMGPLARGVGGRERGGTGGGGPEGSDPESAASKSAARCVLPTLPARGGGSEKEPWREGGLDVGGTGEGKKIIGEGLLLLLLVVDTDVAIGRAEADADAASPFIAVW